MLPKLRSTLLPVLSLLFFCPWLRAQSTINVGPGQPYTTIQSGIDAANTGDTVLVAPGTYYENIDFKGKAITVTSKSGASGGAANTIIDGSKGQNPAVIFRNGESSTSVLYGFTIQNGGFDGYPQPADNYGTGGIVINEATPVISNNILTHNDCNAIQSNDSSPLIENNEIDNTLDPNGHCGFAGGSAIWISGSISYYNGGSETSTPPAMIVGNIIQNNTESGRSDAGGNGGTGIAVWGGYASIIGNIIRNNLTLGDGGAILAFNTNPINIIGNLIYGNQASTDGAISLMPPEDSVGPFIGIVASNTIYGNTQTGAMGGIGDSPPTQVYLDANLGQYLLANNIIVSSGADAVAVGCGSVYNYLSITPLVFDHNDLYNPDGAAYGGVCPDQTGTYGNISSDPKFVNPSSNNFQLRAGSPAIDTGNNSAPLITSTDIAGSPRIQDATSLGYSVIDMGAYETAGSQDAAPTILNLTPSAYFDAGYTFSGTLPLTFTITLASTAGTPAGPVTVYEDTTPLAAVTVGSSGTFVYTPTTLAPGLHAFVAKYPGSGIFPAAVSVKFYLIIPSVSSTQPSTTTTLTCNPSTISIGATSLFSATVTSSSGTPTGSVLFTDNGTTLAQPTLTNGAASYAFTGQTAGTQTILATYAPTGSFTASSASCTVLVQPMTTPSITLTSSLNPAPALTPVTFTAQLSANAGGTIVFAVNGQSITTTPNAAGTSTTTLSTLPAGSYPITATWFAPNSALSAQASLTQVITAVVPPPAPDFSLTGDGTTFVAGKSATAGLQLASVGGFIGKVNVTCNPPFPPGYACTLQFPSIALTGGSSEGFTYTLHRSTSAALIHPRLKSSQSARSRIVLAALFPLTLLSLVGISRKRRALRACLSLALLAMLASATTACGPDQYIPIDIAGTYPISFTATGTNQGSSTPITHTLTVNAVITP